jgi:hypothetical protein
MQLNLEGNLHRCEERRTIPPNIFEGVESRGDRRYRLKKLIIAQIETY